MDKKNLSERDICTKFITPALRKAGWDEITQILEEFSFTKGRIIVRGKLVSRGKAKRADYLLYYKPNIPIAVIEAKDNNYMPWATACSRPSTTPKRCRFRSYFPPTVTGSSSMTGQAPALKKKPRSTTMPSHRRKPCGHAIVHGKA